MLTPVDRFADLALVPRDDRTPTRPVFRRITGDRLRTALQRACTAVGVPTFSPHDLRHRRVSPLHLGGMPCARIGEAVGHDYIAHLVADVREIDHPGVLA